LCVCVFMTELRKIKYAVIKYFIVYDSRYVCKQDCVNSFVRVTRAREGGCKPSCYL